MSETQRIDFGSLRADFPLPALSHDGDKHARGTIVVLGGAAATPGAVVLAGLAALRVGAGRLSMATVAGNAPAVAVAVPEAAVLGLLATPAGGIAATAADQCSDLVAEADAVVIGPGMAGPEEARPFVAAAVSRLPAAATLVLDALALTCGIADADELSKVAARTVITPNDTEARRILDDDAISSSDMGKVLAQQLGVVTVLGTTVATPDGRSFQVQKGNVGLATSGSGDVLAGAIAGLAARGATPLQAALWGLALHSGAGDRLAHRIGPVGYLARELLDELPLMLATEL